MKISGIALGLSALLAASSANADIVYDTITGLPETGQLKLLVLQNHAPLGDAFSAAVPETISSVTVQLNDANATSTTFVNDTGSVLVYLVPDSGGLPSHTATTLNNATLLGSISDTSLLGGDVINNETINTNTFLAPGSYWIELTSGSDPNNFAGTQNPVPTTAAWTELLSTAALGAPGLPTSGFMSSYQMPVANAGIVGATDGYVFEAQIQTPEPASLAVLGVGLMGVGAMRRRTRRATHKITD